MRERRGWHFPFLQHGIFLWERRRDREYLMPFIYAREAEDETWEWASRLPWGESFLHTGSSIHMPSLFSMIYIHRDSMKQAHLMLSSLSHYMVTGCCSLSGVSGHWQRVCRLFSSITREEEMQRVAYMHQKQENMFWLSTEYIYEWAYSGYIMPSLPASHASSFSFSQTPLTTSPSHSITYMPNRVSSLQCPLLLSLFLSIQAFEIY